MAMKKHLVAVLLAAMAVASGTVQAQTLVAEAEVRPVSDIHTAIKSRGWDALYRQYSINDLLNTGKLYVSFTVEPDGRVSWARVLSTTVHNPKFVSAMVDQLRMTRFPARKVAAFTYPRVALGYAGTGEGQAQITAHNADAYVDAMTRVLRDPLAAHPNRAAIYGIRMEAYRAKGMLAEAYADGDAMLALIKDKAPAYVARADIAGRAAQPSLAPADCQQAFKQASSDAHAQACSGRLKIMVAAVKPSGAGKAGMS